MRLRTLSGREVSACFFSLLLFWLTAGSSAAQSLQGLFERIEPSVVKVECPDRGNAATGFVWTRSDTVVSALHVVDGSDDIQVYYPANRVRRRARVHRVLPRADLVLLLVDGAPDVPALKHSSRLPGIEEEVHALGFALNFPAINSFTFKLRYGGRRLGSNVSEQVVQLLQQNGYPSPDLEVLKLGQESLLPGLSGAPIFNRSGEVVAVGDGGLEEGAINVSWAIPASNLDALSNSSLTRTPRAPGTRSLFAAELNLDIGETLSAGAVELIKLKTRFFSELIATADDQLGLHQLSAIFGGFDQTSFRYEIYVEKDSGATFVLPYGAQIEPSNRGLWAVRLPAENDPGRFEMVLQVTKASSPIEAQQKSVLFEELIRQKYPQINWQIDQQWTYLAPYSRVDGLTVRRKAAYGLVSDGFNWIPSKYLFLTFAVKDNVLIALAVINNDNTPQMTYLETNCAVQGFQLPGCTEAYESRRAWAQMVLGVQLTSFGF